MRERIVKYLQRIGRPLSTDEILGECLKIHSPNPATAEKLLSAIVGSDPRISHKGGFWRLGTGSRAREPGGLRRPAALYIERSFSRSARERVRGALVSGTSGLTWEIDPAGQHGSIDIPALHRWVSSEAPDVIAIWNKGDRRLWDMLLSKCGVEPLGAGMVSIRALAERELGPFPRNAGLEDLAARLELPPPALDEPSSMAEFLNSCFQALLARISPLHRLSIESLHTWISGNPKKVDFSRYQFGREFLRQLPESPGVYVMRNRAGMILYVGKSRNLRVRARSYFTPKAGTNKKVARIQEQIHSLEVIPSPNEVEALLMEMRLIRDFHPPINLQSEVHEGRERYGSGRNLILLVGESDGARGYLVRDGTFSGQQMLALGRVAPSRFRNRVRSLFYSNQPRAKRFREPWEMEIVNRWLASSRKRINFVDIDEAGDFENAMRCLNSYLRDPDGLSRKVIYR
jgi:hypothetical protein